MQDQSLLDAVKGAFLNAGWVAPSEVVSLPPDAPVISAQTPSAPAGPIQESVPTQIEVQTPVPEVPEQPEHPTEDSVPAESTDGTV